MSVHGSIACCTDLEGFNTRTVTRARLSYLLLVFLLRLRHELIVWNSIREEWRGRHSVAYLIIAHCENSSMLASTCST